jgi:hypothetical protein
MRPGAVDFQFRAHFQHEKRFEPLPARLADIPGLAMTTYGGVYLSQPNNWQMMATALERELRLIRERLDSIEEALGEEMSEDDKHARTEALREHKEGKTIPFVRKHSR